MMTNPSYFDFSNLDKLFLSWQLTKLEMNETFLCISLTLWISMWDDVYELYESRQVFRYIRSTFVIL